MFCEKHDPIITDKCIACEREDQKALLAMKLAVFLGTNEVETWVSPGGYKLQKITRREAGSPEATPWHQSRKEDAA